MILMSPRLFHNEDTIAAVAGIGYMGRCVKTACNLSEGDLRDCRFAARGAGLAGGRRRSLLNIGVVGSA